ncbi:hypothetical protein NDU88_007152 [Pleurodeles waltl]|uniref:Uncharacterized protein n=1 Tax=Pleurodeles waltl TaxID=8319 RepID=A0AAV7WCN0_PLEWA|nr:hypothetical protein NDU88_007152 [Pleurodeles waltl]
MGPLLAPHLLTAPQEVHDCTGRSSGTAAALTSAGPRLHCHHHCCTSHLGPNSSADHAAGQGSSSSHGHPCPRIHRKRIGQVGAPQLLSASTNQQSPGPGTGASNLPLCSAPHPSPTPDRYRLHAAVLGSRLPNLPSAATRLPYSHGGAAQITGAPLPKLRDPQQPKALPRPDPLTRPLLGPWPRSQAAGPVLRPAAAFRPRIGPPLLLHLLDLWRSAGGRGFRDSRLHTGG